MEGPNDWKGINTHARPSQQTSGEMMALEWRDVDLHKRQLCVQRSDWKGHVTVPKGGRLRYVPLTIRLTTALREHRHLLGGARAV
jgi:integrase